jgi:hypothetical protein
MQSLTTCPICHSTFYHLEVIDWPVSVMGMPHEKFCVRHFTALMEYLQEREVRRRKMVQRLLIQKEEYHGMDA